MLLLNFNNMRDKNLLSKFVEKIELEILHSTATSDAGTAMNHTFHHKCRKR